MKISLLLSLLFLCSIASAQTKSPASPPREFTVTSDECDVSVAELVRDDIAGVKLTRGMQIIYHVPTSDLAEDRITAIGLGASVESGESIDRATYRGVIRSKSSAVQYVSVEFYSGERLIATRRIPNAEDSYHAKAARIYESALTAWRRGQKVKAGQ